MKSSVLVSFVWIGLLGGALAAWGCAAGDTTTADQPTTSSNSGGGGSLGFGGYGGAGGAMMACGNKSCEKNETCETCPFDCGDCPTCDEAPTCTGALSVPTESEHLAECDNGEEKIYTCGSGVSVPVEDTNCTDPQLRFRIRQMNIERGDLITKGIYCVVSAEDGMHSELLITPYKDAKYGKSTFTFPISQSLFWGQGDLYASFSNVTITYDCWESSNSDAYKKLFDDVSDAAVDVSQNAGGYGWVFGTVALAGKIIGGALGAVPDRHILNVQQTIHADALLDLTNGRTWEIREKGGFVASAYDLKLEIQSWGCSTVVESPK